MGEHEPVGQLLHGLLGRGAVERHQRGRAAGGAHQVRAPPLRIDEHRFDLVRASVDGLFDAMDGHDCREGVGLMMTMGTMAEVIL